MASPTLESARPSCGSLAGSLGLQEVGGRVAPVRQVDHVGAREEGIHVAEDLLSVHALRLIPGHGDDHVAAAERVRHLGQALRAGEAVELDAAVQMVIGVVFGSRTDGAEEFGPERGGDLALDRWPVDFALGASGGERCASHRCGAVLGSVGRALDLDSPVGESAQRRPVDAVQLGQALAVERQPREAELGAVGSQFGGVDGAERHLVARQVLGQQRGPAPVWPGRHVGHDDMRVQLRVAGAARAMAIGGGEDARGVVLALLR